MFLNKILAGSFALGLSTLSAQGSDLMIIDPYFRTSGPLAKTGAAFMHIANHGAQDDILIGVSSDFAKRVELHTHIDAGNGVMQMRQVEDGFPIPAGGMGMLKRGGDHIMFMGLTHAVKTGDVVTVTMSFEKSDDLTLDIPVDLERQPSDGAMEMDHSNDG